MNGRSRNRGAVYHSYSTESALPIAEVDKLDYTTKVAIARLSPSLVSLLSPHVPEEMVGCGYDSGIFKKPPGKDFALKGCGIIIECDHDVVTRQYFSTIITAATLFVRPNGVQPSQIMVDVYLSDDKLFKGQVLACDFHYNLAALCIVTSFPLKTATLRPIDDVLPIHPTNQLPLQPHPLAHSNLFKILPGTKLTCVWRTYQQFSHDIFFSSGVFGVTSLNTEWNCGELYWVKGTKDSGPSAEPVINCSGDVIGISFRGSPFLPVNIVLRWWRHFKRRGEYRRPCLGVEVSNLHSLRLDLLTDFMMTFPNISTGVVVTKVTEDSPTSYCGIRLKDVIVGCNGKSVCSKLQFFDMIWGMVGESVEVDVLRVSDGKKFKLNLVVGETTPDKFYKFCTCSFDTHLRAGLGILFDLQWSSEFPNFPYGLQYLG